MSKKVFIFDAENFLQSKITRSLSSGPASSDLELFLSFNDPSARQRFRKHGNIKKILKPGKPKLFRNYLFHSDLIVLDLLFNPRAAEDVALLCQTFPKSKRPKSSKRIVLVSSFLTWKETDTSAVNQILEKYDHAEGAKGLGDEADKGAHETGSQHNESTEGTDPGEDGEDRSGSPYDTVTQTRTGKQSGETELISKDPNAGASDTAGNGPQVRELKEVKSEFPLNGKRPTSQSGNLENGIYIGSNRTLDCEFEK